MPRNDIRWAYIYTFFHVNFYLQNIALSLSIRKAYSWNDGSGSVNLDNFKTKSMELSWRAKACSDSDGNNSGFELERGVYILYILNVYDIWYWTQLSACKLCYLVQYSLVITPSIFSQILSTENWVFFVSLNFDNYLSMPMMPNCLPMCMASFGGNMP